MNWLERIRIRRFEKTTFELYRKQVESLTQAIIEHFGEITDENWQRVGRWFGEIYPPG